MATVVVTGASTGIGAACALRLDQLGHAVIAGVRTDAAAESLRGQASDRLETVRLDVTEPDDVAAAAALVAERVGERGLDGLVNNAGVAVGGPVEYLPLEEWRRQFEVNVIGQVAVTQALLGLLRSAAGRIVFVGSVSGLVSTPLGAPYGASKHAIEAVAQSLRVELHPWGIGVSVVEPGAVGTPIWDKGTAEAQRLRDLMGPDAQVHYGEVMARLEAQIDELRSKAGGPERAVAAIERALFDARPRPRYPAGGDARLISLAARLLPDRVLAEVLRRTGP